MNTLALLALCLLPSVVLSANIFGLFVVPLYSHQKPFLNLCKGLSLRGHKVTVGTTHPLKDKTLTNLTEIDISHLHEVIRNAGFDKVLSSENSLWKKMNGLRNTLDVIDEAIFETKEVKDLINSGNSFDLVMVEPHDPTFFALGPKFNAPVVALSSLGAFLDMHDAMGNPTHPFLAPEVFAQNPGTADASFFQRLDGLLYNIWYRALYKYEFIPRMDKIVKKYLGDNQPSIGETQSKVALLLTTVNPIIDTVRPNVPTVINIEQLHIDDPKPLPKDIKDFLDSSSNGVVYFSLGSNVKSSQLNAAILKTISEALGKLPYKVLWKFETDEFPGKPENIKIKKWLPQQDVLGHPNIKVFITQGGLQSIEEAIFKAVPMVGLPFMGDQPKNVKTLDKWGMGLSLNPKEMTAEELRETIVKVATNSSFKENIMKAKEIIEDQPIRGLEKAIWWIEFVLRHNGTDHWRYLAADMSLYSYLMIDVMSFIFIVIFVIGYVLTKLLLKIMNLSNSHKFKTQ